MVKHLGKLPVLGGGRQSMFTGIENPFCVDSENEMFFYISLSHDITCTKSLSGFLLT